jgi:hypothetical protein
MSTRSSQTILMILLFAFAFGGCKKTQGSSASALSAGTWVCKVDYPDGGHFESALTLDPSGRYACNGSLTSSNRVNPFIIQGIMKIQDGFLIDTWTNHSNANAPIPHESRARIVRQSEREVVARWEGMQFDTTMRSVK